MRYCYRLHNMEGGIGTDLFLCSKDYCIFNDFCSCPRYLPELGLVNVALEPPKTSLDPVKFAMRLLQGHLTLTASNHGTVVPAKWSQIFQQLIFIRCLELTTSVNKMMLMGHLMSLLINMAGMNKISPKNYKKNI